MYKKVDLGCGKCGGKGTYSEAYGGDAYFTSYNTYRCACTMRKSKKFLKSRQEDLGLFYDNNAHFKASGAMDGW